MACPCWQRAVEHYFNPRQPSGLIFMFDKNGKKHKGMRLKYRHASCLHRAAFACSMLRYAVAHGFDAPSTGSIWTRPKRHGQSTWPFAKGRACDTMLTEAGLTRNTWHA